MNPRRIKTPVHVYQMRNSTLWNIRADDNERLSVELTESRAKEIMTALNEHNSLCAVADAAQWFADLQGNGYAFDLARAIDKLNTVRIRK